MTHDCNYCTVLRSKHEAASSPLNSFQFELFDVRLAWGAELVPAIFYFTEYTA